MSKELLQQALDALEGAVRTKKTGWYQDNAIDALRAAIAQPAVTPTPPHGWVLVPNEPATPTPDYDECARQATLATGLPSQRGKPWMNIFIREINRWCQHARQDAAIAQPATVQPAVSDAEVYAACRELFGGIYSGGMDDMRRALEAFAASRALPVVSPEPVAILEHTVGGSLVYSPISTEAYKLPMGVEFKLYTSPQGAPAQAVKLLRHKFWGAGESDCPKDIKASNGELHTMRCKVCGDNWRKSVDVCFGATTSTEGSQS